MDIDAIEINFCQAELQSHAQGHNWVATAYKKINDDPLTSKLSPELKTQLTIAAANLAAKDFKIYAQYQSNYGLAQSLESISESLRLDQKQLEAFERLADAMERLATANEALLASKPPIG